MSTSALTGDVHEVAGDVIALDPTATPPETINNFELEAADATYAFTFADGSSKEVKIAAGSTIADVAAEINDANIGIGAYVTVSDDGTEATIDLISKQEITDITGAGSMTAETTSTVSTTATNIADVDVSTASDAQKAILLIDQAIVTIDSQRADLGAVQNRFENTIANLQNISENASAARGRIQDTDFAAETANLSKNQVLQQAGTAILAQANQLPQAVLSLLR